MSASVIWARSVPVPLVGVGSAGTVIHVAGHDAIAGWETTRLFRVLESVQPTLFDFWSYAKLGRMLANVPSPAAVRGYGGLSVYTGLDGARIAARKYNPGALIAELAVPLNGWFD